jgi:hypothetical protein
LLENQNNNQTISSYETPHNNFKFNDKIPSMPMTPQKHFNLPMMPMVGTSSSSALIKSIVQSAKKTELNSSPVRVPFALSPMALKFPETKLNFSPLKAKDPSLVIKEAFLYNNDTEEDISLPFDNKRPHEESEDEEFAHNQEHEQDGAHLNKREKIEQDAEEKGVENGLDLVEGNNKIEKEDDVCEEVDMNEYINNTYEMESQTSHNNYTSSATADDNISSLDSLPPLHSSSSNVFPPTNFSTDLLRNLKDPEFASPELSSAPDCRVSRSEVQDKYKNEVDTDDKSLNELINDSTPSINRSLSKSSSSGSSTKNNPLLPSGIVKLLEKKRQERDQHPQSTSSTSTTSTAGKEGKKKFDLKESLKRPLNYKPHIGSIPKKD